MRSLNISQLLCEGVSLDDIVTWDVSEPLGFTRAFDNSGKTEFVRSCSVLCLYNEGRRKYRVSATGEEFELSPCEVMYVPQSGEYSFEITDCGADGHDYAIAANFVMRTREGEPVTLGTVPRVLTRDRLGHYFALFRRLKNVSAGGPMNVMMTKSLLYALFYEVLCDARAQSLELNPYTVIMPAIASIEGDPAADLPIPFLARSCGVSETTFRKLFLLYSGGISPVDYRNRLRIDLADRILRTEMTTVEYAAKTAGFGDLSHFYRLYKKYKGFSPRADG